MPHETVKSYHLSILIFNQITLSNFSFLIIYFKLINYLINSDLKLWFLGYSYIDANGILQTVAYSADAENGFRVRASNLPQQPTAESLLPVSETPEVAVARRRHLEEFEEIENNINRDASSDKTSWQVVEGQVQGQNIPNSVSEDYKHSQYERDTSEKKSNDYQGASNLKNPFLLTGAEALRIEIPKPDPSLLKAERNREGNVQSYQQYQNLGPNAIFQQPLPNVRRTIVAPATSFVLPVVPYSRLHSSLHHTQDSLGQYDYSYVGDTSSKTESRSLDGTTRGAYSYVDANGLLQQVHYIADHNGFRVIATNLPEAWISFEHVTEKIFR